MSKLLEKWYLISYSVENKKGFRWGWQPANHVKHALEQFWKPRQDGLPRKILGIFKRVYK